MPSIFAGKNPTYIKSWRRNPKAIDKFQFIYHFLPHPDKKTRAGLLSHKSIIVYCLLILLVTGLFRLIPLILPGVLGYASDINISDLFRYTNEERKSNGLAELRLNEKLSNAARKKGSHMLEKNYWAHISPDGVEPWDFILGENYDYIYAGENLAKNFSHSKDVVKAWLNSTSHRDNLLSPNYDEVGFSVVNGVLDGYETTLVVQIFGRPRSKAQVASVFEEKNLLKEIEESRTEVAANVSPSGGPGFEIKMESPKIISKKPVLDVGLATRTISLTFGGFIGSLLVLDIWYSKRKGILKFTGHTFAHLTLLLLVIFCVWFVLKPGVII
jgi:hypothetical protein